MPVAEGFFVDWDGNARNTLTDIEKAGIKASFVPGSHPWGRPDEGF